MKIIIYILLTLVLTGSVLGGIGKYDFEINPNPPGGQSMSLPMTGTTAGIQRVGPNNGIQLQSSGAPRFGNLSLASINSNDGAYVINLVRGTITSFSLEFGDFDPDVDAITITAYSTFTGAGNELTSTTETLSSDQPGFNYKRITLRAAGIRSVVISGSVNSVYFDNFEVITVPNSTAFTSSTGVANQTVFRPSEGNWYSLIRDNVTNFTNSTTRFGAEGDKPVPGDYDGKGLADVAVFRSGIWYIKSSESNEVQILSFGLPDDVPTPADYDGDGKTDIAVFRPSEGIWYWLNSSDNNSFSAIRFGLSGDFPLPGNYDLDGKADFALFRPSTGIWYEYLTGNGTVRVRHFGQNGDVPVPADYDSDGLNDLAIYRFGVWWILGSYDNSVQIEQFGLPDDIPVPADYLNVFGDTAAEIAVFRPSTGFWYVKFYDFGGISILPWGLNGDVPISLVNK